MSRIAIAEVEDFLEKLKKSNTEASRWLTDFQQAVIAYTNESRVSGEAVDRSKAYYEVSYVPLVETVLQAMTMSEELLAQYIQDFYSQVDATPDMFINAERLQDVMEDVRRLEREKERITQSMSGGMGTTRQGQHLQYSMRLYEAIEAEKVLEKYIAFEQSHTTFFAPFSELVRAVQRAVDALQNQVQFNAETGLYSVAKTFAPAMKSLQKSLNEARGIDPKLDAQLEEYLLFKVAYKDSSGKEQAMWILEKDGVRVPNSELEAYLKRTADYQDEDKYTILTLEELNEKIMKAWQDKTYYMDGKVYSGAAGSILQASAYVEDWEGQLAESGIMSALSGVGLGAAIARGSKAYKGGSGAKTNTSPKTRLPRTNGKWSGEPGNGKWFSNKPEVDKITGGKGVEFKNGRPDFSPWSKGDLNFKPGQLNGTPDDFSLVYEKIQQQYKLPSKNAAKKMLKDIGVTPHHKSPTKIELIPSDLHGNIPHIGSAADMRGGF